MHNHWLSFSKLLSLGKLQRFLCVRLPLIVLRSVLDRWGLRFVKIGFPRRFVQFRLVYIELLLCFRDRFPFLYDIAYSYIGLLVFILMNLLFSCLGESQGFTHMVGIVP